MCLTDSCAAIHRDQYSLRALMQNVLHRVSVYTESHLWRKELLQQAQDLQLSTTHGPGTNSMQHILSLLHLNNKRKSELKTCFKWQGVIHNLIVQVRHHFDNLRTFTTVPHRYQGQTLNNTSLVYVIPISEENLKRQNLLQMADAHT